MKYIKSLAILFVSIVVFTACEDDDEVSFILQEVSAPTNLSAVFDVTQDDTGTVSVTPAAEGASSFDIFFGDEEEEVATTIAPGATATNIYPEGDFIVRIIATGLTGLTSEFVQNITISFRAPENLVVDLVQSTSNPTMIEVTASADFATVFEVFFGDVENEEATNVMPGETIMHTYAAPGEYVVRVIAKGAGSATVEFTQTVTVPEANDPVSLPITFDVPTVNYALGTFNGASFEVVDNPDLSGSNPEASLVGAITNAGVNFEGGAYNLGTPVDFSGSNKTIKMDFWSTTSVPILLKFEGGVNGERQNEVVATHGGTGWEEITFDFAVDATKSFIDGSQGVGEPFVPTGQYATVVIFIDGPGTTAGTFYIDNVEQVGSAVPPGVVELPVDFESTTLTYDVLGFEGADSAVEMNPFPTGINTSGTVLRSTKTNGAQFFAGTILNLDTPIDFSTIQMLQIDTYSPKATIPIRIALENKAAGGGSQVFVDVNTTVVDTWETLVADFSSVIDPNVQYDRVIVFFEFIPDLAGDGSTYFYDNLQLADTTPPAVVELPVDFESTTLTYDILGFEGADSAVEMNPFPTGINTSATVLRSTKTDGAQFFAGTILNLGAAIDFSTTQMLQIDTYSPKANIPIRIALENQAAGGGSQVFVDVNTTVVDTWETLVADFSSVIDPNVQYDRVVVFFEFIPDLAGDGSTYFYDNLRLAN